MTQLSSQPSARQFLRATLAVLAKDVKCELRERYAVGAVLLFAVTSTVAVSFTLGAWGGKSEIAAALLWIVIYFSAMSGLSRSFVREEETLTVGTLKLAACPNSVFVGKLVFNLVVLLAVEVVTVPMFVTLTGCSIARLGCLVAMLALGSVALSVGATMAAAMVAKASAKGALYAVVSFPLLIPVLAVAIHGSSAAMGGQGIASDIRLLASYIGMVTAASLMLFRFIWEN